MTSPWIFERNLILQAGAGTGKTHALVTLALHLLSGATQRRTPVPASRLVALTFTDKAGAEMRGRLLKRLAPLAEGKSLADCKEMELIQSLDLLKLPAPSAADWRRIRREVPLAIIGTFHSFCTTQLRRLAGRTQVEPNFEMVDERDSRDLFDTVSRDRILELLANGDEGATKLVDEYNLTEDNGNGVIELIRSVLMRTAEEGRSPVSLDDGRFSDAKAAEELTRAIEEMRAAVAGLRGMERKYVAKFAEPIAAFNGVMSRLTPGNLVESIGQLWLARKTFKRPSGEAGQPLVVFNERLEQLESAAAGVRIAPLGRAFVALATDVEKHCAEVRRRRNLVDFADLLRLLRDVLRDDRQTRALVKSRFDVLLVDEFQDTSQLQSELVTLLAESRAEERDLESVRLEPGLLCIVGDRKQSIYEFRGADVAVFSRAKEMLTDARRSNPPALVENLSKSWRSRPALIQLVNALFRRLMASSAQSFDIAFMPEDELTAEFKESPSGPLAEVIEVQGKLADDKRQDEAKALAARIQGIVSGTNSVAVRIDKTAKMRPAEGRDIAVLFRSLGNLELYRDALAAQGIAHVVVGGGGFYETREVLDAWALLRAIDDPADAVATVALLRSPWCALSDETITRLSMVEADGKARFTGVTMAQLSAGQVSGAEGERLDALLKFFHRAQGDLDRLGARKILRLALDELDYLAVASAQPDADGVAANLEKLLGLLGRFESRGTTARGAIRTLTEAIRETPREPEAPSSEESDPRSVRLMTIHQAKGLEFPIVILPDCAWSTRMRYPPIEYERDLGLAFSIRQGDEDERKIGPGMQDVRDRLAGRSKAEDLRLLYVAMTRAQDYFIVTGSADKGFAFAPIAALGPAHVKTVDVDRTAPPRAVKSTPKTAAAPPAQRVTSLPVHRVVTTVTRLKDFAECPERYRLRHEIGLTEPSSREQDPARLSTAELGALAHKLIKLVEFKPIGDGALDDLIRADGADPQRPEVMEVRRNIRAILDSPAAMTLRELPPARRLQEVPFQLAVATETGRVDVKGQIDLLTLSSEAVRVFDYKLTTAEMLDFDSHRFQLATYAVAAREMISGSPLPVQVGIVPLLSPDAPVEWTPLSPDELDAHVDELRELSGSMTEALATNRWAKLPIAKCQQLKCGFVRRCHAASNSA